MPPTGAVQVVTSKYKRKYVCVYAAAAATIGSRSFFFSGVNQRNMAVVGIDCRIAKSDGGFYNRNESRDLHLNWNWTGLDWTQNQCQCQSVGQKNKTEQGMEKELGQFGRGPARRMIKGGGVVVQVPGGSIQGMQGGES